MSKLDKLKELAKVVSDGHYTILSFNGNYRVALGTMSPQGYFDYRLQMEDMPSGGTLDEAIEECIKQGFNFFHHEGYGDIDFDEWDELTFMTKEQRSKWRKKKNLELYEKFYSQENRR